MFPLCRPLEHLGNQDNPFAGRLWLRQFPHGDFEALYRSHAKAPSEIEYINAWLEESGSENRVTWKSISGGVSAYAQEEKEKREPTESNEDRVKRRAKQKLRWNIKCIGADRLLTLTFRDNVTDYDQAEKALTKFLAYCRREWGASFAFCAVPERQKRGAWHFHLALRGYWNIDKLRGFWWRSLGERVVFSTEGKPVLKHGGLTPGNVDITSPRVRGQVRRSWASDRLAAYLAKYISKTIGSEDLGGSPSYRATRGLKPEISRYVVKALTFADVVEVFLSVASPPGVSSHVFQSPDRQVLWAAGKIKQK